jgi:hypothetical protein
MPARRALISAVGRPRRIAQAPRASSADATVDRAIVRKMLANV